MKISCVFTLLLAICIGGTGPAWAQTKPVAPDPSGTTVTNEPQVAQPGTTTTPDAAAVKQSPVRNLETSASDRGSPLPESEAATASDPSAAKFWPVVFGALTASVLLVLAVLAFVLRLRNLEHRLSDVHTRLDSVLRERKERDKGKRDEAPQWKQELRAELEPLRSAIGKVAADTQRLITHATSQRRFASDPASAARPAPAAVPHRETHDETRTTEDAVGQLLSIANRIVQQSSTTLDAFRASAGSLAAHVSAWPTASDGVPAAFIVEHRGAYYAVPNVVKPARLPQEWFNRSDFGVNDEIQRVDVLPRLRRRGDGYDVQEPGVFGR